MTRPPLQFERALIVEDDGPLSAAIARHVGAWGGVVVEAGDAVEATAALSPVPDLIIADIRLPGDRSGLDLLEEAAGLWPKPMLVAISGKASAEEAFRLAQIGVRDYLAKPFTLSELQEAVERACEQPPELDLVFSNCVGRVPLKELQGQLRGVMVHQALARAHGSRSGAARLLSISRQAIQQQLKSAEPDAEAQGDGSGDVPATAEGEDSPDRVDS